MGMDRLGDSVSGLGRINDLLNLTNVRPRDDEPALVVPRWDALPSSVDKSLESVCFSRNLSLLSS